jgi:hypothetical protein
VIAALAIAAIGICLAVGSIGYGVHRAPRKA